MSDSHPHSSPPPPERDFTDREIPIGKILLAGFYIAIFTALTFVALRFFFHYLDRSSPSAAPASSTYADRRVVPPQPLLEVNEPRTWQQQLADENEQIQHYGWVDRAAGVVHIPVERAMDLIAERGLPARTPVAK